MFTPDVDGLLKRFDIEKPNEQFEFGPVAPDPVSSPDPLNKTEFEVPVLPIVTRLEQEATKVQDILDILSSTADELSVPVPLEEIGFIGQSVTTRDYLKSLEASDTEDPFRQRKQQAYEWGVMSTYGDNPHWPVLMTSDLIDIRNTLLNSRDMIEGRLLADQEVRAADGGNAWKGSVLNSDLIHVHESMILASEQVRFKVAQTVFTMNFSLKGAMLDHLLSLALDPQIERLRPNLVKIDSFLRQIRSLLTHSQMLLAFEYQRTRQSILNIVETAIVDRLIQILVVKLSGVMDSLVNPVIHSLENGLGNGPITQILTDDVSHQLVSVVGGTIEAIVSQYKGVAADLLRQHTKKTNLQLDKLQSLGERNVVGRWILHIDQVTTVIEKALTDLNLTRQLSAELIQRAISPPAAPNHPTYQQFLSHPELSQARDQNFKLRTLGITPGLIEPSFVPFSGEGQNLADSVFGGGSVNPKALNSQ
jgi:hypothetical protein